MKKVFIILSLFSILACSKDTDPCEGIVCYNGGHCSNGECVCPEGYTGADCSQIVTPLMVRVSKITVLQFPATDGGAGWDLTSGPDITVRISKGNTTIWQSPTYYENAEPNISYDFDPGTYIDLYDPTNQYTFELYDFDDLSSNDLMGVINFAPFNSNDGFAAPYGDGIPNIIIMSEGGIISVGLYISYSW